MFLLDRLFVGGIRFVLDKLAQAADAELNDADTLRAALLDAQMRHELGELSAEDVAQLEAAIMQRLREIEQRKRGGGPLPTDARISGVEISFGGDEHGSSAPPARPEPVAPARPRARKGRRKR